MRAVNTSMRKMILLPLLLITSVLCATSVLAVELDLQLEPTAWHYKEFEKKPARFAASLPSAAQGEGALVKIRVSTERDLSYFLALSASWMDSAAWAEETWGTTQTNALKIKQQDVRLDMQYRMLDVRWGIWLSQRVQTQHRQDFYVNSVLTTLKNEPIPEVITSSWAGVSIVSVGGTQGQFEAVVEVATSLDVEVTNPLFSKPFTKTDGQRAGVRLRWLLPEREVGLSGLNLTLRFEYQVLGGETQATGGFWPYNRWLMASVGMLYAW